MAYRLDTGILIRLVDDRDSLVLGVADTGFQRLAVAPVLAMLDDPRARRPGLFGGFVPRAAETECSRVQRAALFIHRGQRVERTETARHRN